MPSCEVDESSVKYSELFDWVERKLESIGLDGKLYVRVIKSVLRTNLEEEQLELNYEERNKMRRLKNELLIQKILLASMWKGSAKTDEYGVLRKVIWEFVKKYTSDDIINAPESLTSDVSDTSSERYEEAFPPLSTACDKIAWSILGNCPRWVCKAAPSHNLSVIIRGKPSTNIYLESNVDSGMEFYISEKKMKNYYRRLQFKKHQNRFKNGDRTVKLIPMAKKNVEKGSKTNFWHNVSDKAASEVDQIPIREDVSDEHVTNYSERTSSNLHGQLNSVSTKDSFCSAPRYHRYKYVQNYKTQNSGKTSLPLSSLNSRFDTIAFEIELLDITDTEANEKEEPANWATDEVFAGNKPPPEIAGTEKFQKPVSQNLPLPHWHNHLSVDSIERINLSPIGDHLKKQLYKNVYEQHYKKTFNYKTVNFCQEFCLPHFHENHQEMLGPFQIIMPKKEEKYFHSDGTTELDGLIGRSVPSYPSICMSSVDGLSTLYNVQSSELELRSTIPDYPWLNSLSTFDSKIQGDSLTGELRGIRKETQEDSMHGNPPQTPMPYYHPHQHSLASNPWSAMPQAPQY